ncbi:MAG: lactonase family protein [Candidatus Zixiibacteriota bacterium]
MMKAIRLLSVLAGALALALFISLGCGDDNSVVGPRKDGPPGRLFTLNQADATMFVFDTKTMAVIDTVDTRVKKPHYIEFSPDGQFFYIVTLETTGHLAKFDAATYAFIDSVMTPPGVQPTAIAITSDSKFGYVCNFSLATQRTLIHKFDLATLQTVGSALAGAMTHDIKITGDGSVVIACNRFSDDLTLLYPGPDTVVFVSIDPDSLYPVGSNKYGPFGVAVDHRDSLAFIACMDALQVRVLDIGARRIVDSIDIPVDTTGFIYGPTLLAVSPDNDLVYLTTRGGNTVVVFRVSTMTVLAQIPLSVPYPFGIDISDDGSMVYVACVNTPTKQGRIYAIDGVTFAKVDSVDVGGESFGLAWRPLVP